MQLVVLKLIPNSGKSPSRCKVKVSSNPSSKLLTADSLSNLDQRAYLNRMLRLG